MIPVNNNDRKGGNVSNSERTAVVTSSSSLAAVQAYLPSNYRAEERDGEVFIVGSDVAGWTLDDYVLPRLLSGLHAAKEVRS
jgi:hypothetical protein